MSSDAWLLLAILYSEGAAENGASLSSIISTADYINHAILTYDELRDGLLRLQANACIAEQAGQYRATESMRAIYRGFARPGRPVWKDLAAVESYLAARPAEMPTADFAAPRLERAAYDAALNAYRQRSTAAQAKRQRKSKA